SPLYALKECITHHGVAHEFHEMFILGVLFFPFVWIISFAFIKRSIALEEAEVKEVQSNGPAKS
ncbi:MAG: hypothetical protein EBR79_01275, partial [Proteobacteria bacterium]|nr:hypothetical protein [Pseudomonadota bacterium]